MNLGTKARYAVMAMVELAQHDAKKPVTLAELAQAQEITVPYLEQLFTKLKKQGLVRSVRGPGGGYVLVKSAADTSILEIVQAVEESMEMTRCSKLNNKNGQSHHGCMSTRARCLTHDLWHGLELQIHYYLQGVTLADIVTKRTLVTSGMLAEHELHV